jgi:hypothetical protein
MAGQRLALDESVANLLIGSDPSCDFYLPHDSVSPIHARLWLDLDGAVLHDTSSPHGLYVNDERVVGKHPLRNGDVIWLGSPGGADVVMIQCVLPDKPAAAPEVEEPAADGVAEREALESLAPTLAAGPSFASYEPAGNAEPPAWEPEPPPLPGAPAAAVTPDPLEDDDSSRTVAFKIPADLAAAMAAAEPAPPPLPPPAAAPDPPPVPARADELDTLWVEHTPEPPPVPVAPSLDETVVDPHAYAEPEPTMIAGGEPVYAEPALAESSSPEIVEPEPEIIEPMLPEPEPSYRAAASGGSAGDPAAAPPGSTNELPGDFDDMMFSVPDESPGVVAPPPVPAAPPAAPPVASALDDLPEETMVLAPPAPAPPAAVAPPPSTPAPAVAAAAPPAPAVAPPTAPPAAPPAAPAPRPAAPAAPAAARAAGTPAAASGTGRQTPVRPAAPRAARPAAPPPAPARSGGLPVAALAGGGVLLVVLAAAGYWFFGRSAPAPRTAIAAQPTAVPPTMAPAPPEPVAATPEPPPPEPEPTPEAVATVAPTEDVVTIVRTATPPPRVPSAPPSAAATPRPVERRPDPVDPAAATRARIAAQVTSLLGQAEAAVSARNFDAAAAHYDEVLKLDPQNGAAQAGKTSVAASRAHARKAFVAARTVVRTAKAGGGLAGFDSSGVNLQKAPDFQGRVEFEMKPASVQPGDPWELKVYVVNEGKKAIKISALEVATTVNGSPSGTGGAPRNREVAPQQRVIVDQLSGTWPPGVTSWRTDVKVSAGKNDSLQSQLTWR